MSYIYGLVSSTIEVRSMKRSGHTAPSVDDQYSDSKDVAYTVTIIVWTRIMLLIAILVRYVNRM